MDPVERFIRELKSDSVTTRRYAAEMLGRLGDPRAIDPLIDAVENDADPNIRADAVGALASFSDERAVNAIIRALDSDYRYVGMTAAGVLSEFRTPSVVDALANTVLHNKTFSVRVVAAESLGKIGDPRAVDALSHAVQHDAEFEVRIAAAQSLGKLRDPRAIDALGAVFKTLHWRLRATAVNALSNIGDPRGVEFVCQSLDSPDSFEKESALKFLERFRRDARVLEPFANAVRNYPRPAVYEYIAQAIHPIVITHPDAMLALSVDDRRALENASAWGGHARIRDMLCMGATHDHS